VNSTVLKSADFHILYYFLSNFSLDILNQIKKTVIEASLFFLEESHFYFIKPFSPNIFSALVGCSFNLNGIFEA
jgi:hypothetical protein